MIFAPMVVNILGFKVNVLDHSSVVTMGPSQYLDQFISYKRNQGFGESNGDISPVNIPVAWLMDSDLADSNSVKNSVI